MKYTRRLNQVGDTIVEVMIAVVVLSLTIGGAYGIATRSLRAGRQAQERGEALKLAESQLENIKAQATQPGTTIFTTSNFCFDTSGAVKTAGCTFNLYTVSITHSPLANNVHQFDVSVQWPSINLNGNDQLIMHYRVIDEST